MGVAVERRLLLTATLSKRPRRGRSSWSVCSTGWPDVVFACHDGEEIGPRMLARIAKRTGFRAIVRLLQRHVSSLRERAPLSLRSP